MRKIALITLLSLPLFSGFFPQTVHTSISSVSKDSVSLNNPFPTDGMSGVIVHDYGNGLEAITSRIVQDAPKTVKLLTTDIIHHDELPTIKTAIKAGDKVIGGHLYNNVLLLAPDAQTYTRITSQHNKNWIHPDLYALFLSKAGEVGPSKQNLASFAKEYQVGLIYIIAQNKAKLLDPISGKIINQKPLSNLPQSGKSPFFMRLNKIDTGWFGRSKLGNYYQIMENL